MPKKEPKHPRDMTSDEVIAHVFHPNAVKHLKDHIAGLEVKKPKRPKRSVK